MTIRSGRRWPVHLALIVISFVTIAPFVWMLLTSFKTFEESVRMPPAILPEAWDLVNYRIVMDKFPFHMFYWNTFAMMGMTVLCQLIVCSMAGYAFARLDFPAKEFLFTLCLALLMVPGQIFLVPHYDIMVRLKLNDTVTALWLPKVFSAFGTFMLRQSYLGIPRDYDDAALIDGASTFRIYWNVLLPQLGPSLATLTIIRFMAQWNEFLYPMIITSKAEMRTLTVGLGTVVRAGGPDAGLTMAGAAMGFIPTFIIFIIGQRYIIQGVALSGLKG